MVGGAFQKILRQGFIFRLWLSSSQREAQDPSCQSVMRLCCCNCVLKDDRKMVCRMKRTKWLGSHVTGLIGCSCWLQQKQWLVWDITGRNWGLLGKLRGHKTMGARSDRGSSHRSRLALVFIMEMASVSPKLGLAAPTSVCTDNFVICSVSHSHGEKAAVLRELVQGST